jgi:hypothetical protein
VSCSDCKRSLRTLTRLFTSIVANVRAAPSFEEAGARSFNLPLPATHSLSDAAGSDHKSLGAPASRSPDSPAALQPERSIYVTSYGIYVEPVGRAALSARRPSHDL